MPPSGGPFPRRAPLLLVALAVGAAAGGCGAELPEDVFGYATRCIRLNLEPIPSTGDDDPHDGLKNVFACNVPIAQLALGSAPPYPEGTLIVKESRRPHQDWVWLVATARKEGGAWVWDEYKRNFANDTFRRIPSGEGVCVDCHRQVVDNDWMFTVYEDPGR